MSGNKVNRQAVFAAQTTLNPNQAIDEVAMFSSNGQPISLAPFINAITDTVAATAAKTTTTTEPAANTLVFLKFTGGNTVPPTVAFAGGTARTVWLGGAPAIGSKHTVSANGVLGFWFDGTILHQLGSM